MATRIADRQTELGGGRLAVGSRRRRARMAAKVKDRDEAGVLAMRDEGSSEKWQSTWFSDHPSFEGRHHEAFVGELAVARNGATLHADGGPCPLIAIYRPDAHLGAVLHVDGASAESNGDNHEELIDRLLLIEPDIVPGAVCHVLYDAVPAPAFQDEEGAAEQAEMRGAYVDRIKAHLEARGVAVAGLILEGEYKTVDLDTAHGRLTVTDGFGAVIFEHVYGDEALPPAPEGEPGVESPTGDQEAPPAAAGD